MAYDESLAGRIRDGLAGTIGIVEKKMFGGIGFLLAGNLCVGVWKDSLVVRLDADAGTAALKETHVRPFDVTGRPMRGWILVDPPGVAADKALNKWVCRAVEFVRTLPAKP